MFPPFIKKLAYFIVPLMLLVAACKEDKDEDTDTSGSTETVSIPSLGYTFYSAHPHDTNAFTEGLFMHEGKLYESTGSPEDMPQTRSLFGVVDLKTGKIDVKAELDRNRYFGEGITILGDKLYQLTYQTKVGFIYDAKTFKRTGEFIMPGKEGWGLTTDGTHLIMSEGSHRLFYINPANMQTVKTLEVKDNMGNVNYLNELEFINGFIYANKYGSNLVVKIDPADGRVAGRVDFTRLASQAQQANPGSLEMNGIAYDAAKERIYVTGKMWPYIFEVTIP